MRRAGPLIVVLAAAACVILWAARSCRDSEPVQEGARVGPPQAQQPAPPVQPAPAQPERQPGDSLLHAPADYLRTTTITIPRHARATLDVAQVQSEIKQFYALEGRYPRSLDELAQWRGEPLPQTPKGHVYVYDPATGKVDVVPGE